MSFKELRANLRQREMIAADVEEDAADGRLRVGDRVRWKGYFGMNRPPIEVTVMRIEITGGAKYGEEVQSVDWSEVYGRNVVVDLDGNRWSYGAQIMDLCPGRSAERIGTDRDIAVHRSLGDVED